MSCSLGQVRADPSIQNHGHTEQEAQQQLGADELP